MAESHPLTLFRPGEALDAPLPDLPPDLPRIYRNAGRLINHGLLAGEILGLDTREAQRTVNVVGEMPESVIQAYDDEDAAVLAELLSAVAKTLSEALDDEGKPRGPLGERLAHSEYLLRDDQGRLFFKSHRVLLDDLLSELRPFVRYLDFAAKHGLWLFIGAP